MENNYSSKNYNKENMARAIGKSLPISFKQSIEICDFIRNKNVNYAKDALTKIINHELAIPFKRFNMNVGHKKNMAAGRYPKRASMEILNLITHVEANAQFKGINTSNLVITHINANKSSKVMHFGRKRSREAKRTNVEVVVQEKADKKPEKRKINAGKSLKEQKEGGKQDKKTQEKDIQTKAKGKNEVTK
jgi:large subunit ribosomal protein L22|tara:strand:+ start:593 stop:1165 length:573 start_codon:yes stop_codon:yes gene_type:complete